MIPATTIKTVVLDSGYVNISFVGTKQGLQFENIAAMKIAVDRARETVADQDLLLVLGEHLDTDPTLSDTTALAGKKFSEPRSAVGEVAALGTDFS